MLVLELTLRASVQAAFFWRGGGFPTNGCLCFRLTMRCLANVVPTYRRPLRVRIGLGAVF